MPWTKREGIVLLLVLCLVLPVARRARRYALLGAGALAFSGLVLSGPWWAFVATQGIAAPDFLPITLPTFLANLARVPAIARLVLPDLLSGNWNFVWPLALLVVLLAKRTAQWRSALLLIAAVIYLATMSASFIFSDYAPYQQHVVSSIDRIIAHVVAWPLLWLAVHSFSTHGDSA